MKRFVVVALVGLCSTAALAQGVPEKAATCVACHGEGGAKPILAEYPVLAGQHADYLAQSLREYKSGRRKNPVMAAQSANLSESEIKQLAEYFSLQPSPLYTPSIPARAGN